MNKVVCWLTLGAALLLGAGAATAQEGFGLDEVRGGLFFHSVDHAPADSFLGFLDTRRLEDANIELLFTPLDFGPGWIGELRPHVGATVNFGGLESQVYAGLSWTWHVFDGPVFVEGSFGAALHSGASDGVSYPARNLGCPALFRESLSLGYDLTEQASVMATFEHSSHAGLCGEHNEGITNLGVRVGWSF